MSLPTSDAKLIAQIAGLLDALGPFSPNAPREDKWRTTEQIADALLETYGRSVDLDDLDRLLHNYEAQYRKRMQQGLPPEALIRRATYPDRTTVLPLWGSAKHNGQPWPEQPGLERTDPMEDIPPARRVPADAPRVFVSHTHYDAQLATRLAEALAQMGIGAWLFETQIERRGNIPACVKSALAASACCVALVTRDSIASLWVLTELHSALQHKQCVMLAIDTADKQLLQLLRSVRFPHPEAAFDLSVEYDHDIVGNLRKSYRRHQPASRIERYREQVHDFLATLPLYLNNFKAPALAFPDLPDHWSGPISLTDLRAVQNISQEGQGSAANA